MAVVAWPPPTPPNTRTDNEPQTTVHAADHNKIADALDTLIARATPTAWTALPLASGWTNYTPGAAGFAPAMYRKAGDVVQLRGLISRSPVTGGSFVIATMPVGFQAPARLLFYAPTNGGVCRVDMWGPLSGDGGNANELKTVNLVGSAVDLSFLSLTGIAWSVG